MTKLRTGGIGRGWYPEQPEDELQTLATQLLKEKLAEIFEINAENHKNGKVRGVNGPRFYK